MLEFRPSCECCDTDLRADQETAWICSLECTFCTGCAQRKLDCICPNCGGELAPRPRRARRLWQKFPVSGHRVHVPGHCDAAVAVRAGRS